MQKARIVDNIRNNDDDGDTDDDENNNSEENINNSSNNNVSNNYSTSMVWLFIIPMPRKVQLEFFSLSTRTGETNVELIDPLNENSRMAFV